MNRRGIFFGAFGASLALHAMLVGAALFASHSHYSAPRTCGIQESQVGGSLEMLDDSDKGPVFQQIDLTSLPPGPETTARSVKLDHHADMPVESLMGKKAEAHQPTFSPFDSAPNIQAIGVAADTSTALPKISIPRPHFAPKPLEVKVPTTAPTFAAVSSSTAVPQIASSTESGIGGTGSTQEDHSVQHAFAGPRVAKPGGRGTRGKGTSNGYDSRGIPIPDYPSESRRRGEEGLVVLEVEVLADGTTGNVTVISEPGSPRLVNSAINAIRGALFEPATLDGIPVKGRIKVPFRFVLTR